MTPVKAGKLRPSQAVTQFGPGALVDLPTLSMVVAGADTWNLQLARRVDEPRLARKLRVDNFREPPFYLYKQGIGGVKARIFPKFLVCPRCNRLALHTAFEFDAKNCRHLCKAQGCKGLGKAIAYPVRFMVACPRGHLDEFPWHAYVHAAGVSCAEELRLEDSGQTGAITDLWVKCPTHNVSKNLGQAFGKNNRKRLPRCTGVRPWLGDVDPKGCGEELHILLRGASNAYFPVVESAISIPPWSDPLQLVIGNYVELLLPVDSLEKLRLWLQLTNAPDLKEYTPEQIWSALQQRRHGEDEPPPDLRFEEWRAFQVQPTSFYRDSEFQLRTVPVPESLQGFILRVALLERMREVRALRGLTRIDPVPDIGDMGEVDALQAGMAPITKHRVRWLPGVEFRGEGILIQLREDVLSTWERGEAVQATISRRGAVEIAWHKARNVDLKKPKPARYVLLHSLSHLIIRELSLRCGYSSASLRERIYSSTDIDQPMAGILIYTASSDSEGSLGGLVEMGRPDRLGPLVERALEEAHLCANDPLCADREPSAAERELNGAACHACLLTSETSCESGNHYLDRALVVPTLRNAPTAFIR